MSRKTLARTRHFLLILFTCLAALAVLAACNQAAPVTPGPAPTSEATATAPLKSTALIYFVALEDNGQSGKLVGCGDSLIGVEVEIPADEDPLQAALTALLATKDRTVGESGLYNALYQSNLAVESIAIDASGIASVHLIGETMLGGVCDNPRFEGQILETILQHPEVEQASVYINGVPLADFVSGR